MKILIFGGSFDPPHRGHLELLSAAVRRLNPDRVLAVPALHAPLKGAPSASAAERARMLSLALKGLPAAQRRKVRVLRYELERGRRTYSYELLRELRRRHPSAEFYFLAGSDSLQNFKRWRRWREILRGASLVIGRRPGFSAGPESEGLKLQWLPGLFPAVSSTQLRRRIAAGEAPRALLNPAVLRLIEREGLYGRGLQRWLKRSLSPERYLHTLAVAKLAESLAAAHGLSPDAARSAALLHDAGRSIDTAELAGYVRRHKLAVPLFAETARQAPILLHAYASAHLARTLFGVRDAEILKAVANHTLGAPRMGGLEKVVYVADASSEDRSYPGAAKIRKMAFKDLDRAFLAAARQKLSFALASGLWVHPRGIKLWNELSTKN